MSDQYQGEIRMFAGTFAPFQWAFCNHQILSISEYQALYAILGTTYGGDGRTSFALPEMRGRIPVGQGQGPGLSNRVVGQMFGRETVTLTTNELPSHTHTLYASASAQSTTNPISASFATINGDGEFYAVGATNAELTQSSTDAVKANGGGQAHDNIQPSLVVNYIIAMQGLFPPRS